MKIDFFSVPFLCLLRRRLSWAGRKKTVAIGFVWFPWHVVYRFLCFVIFFRSVANKLKMGGKGKKKSKNKKQAADAAADEETENGEGNGSAKKGKGKVAIEE